MHLSDLRPLLNEQVEHLSAPARDIFGQLAGEQTSTPHAARVIMSPGTTVAPASGEKIADAKATIWLLNHPHPVRIGDLFVLPGDDRLRAIRVEIRTSGRDTLTKVFLS